MRYILGSLLSLVLVVTGCGGGTQTPPPPPAATSIAYPIVQSWGEVGQAFGPWSPTVSGGSASQYTVSPALPAGLAVNPATGVLSGTPQSRSAWAIYRISAQVGGATAAFDLTLEVQAPPNALSYASPLRIAVGKPMIPLQPAVSGDVDGYSITPALPAGLQLDPATGVLSGTATSARVTATYTVVASNYGGSSTAGDLVLTVDPPPTGTPMTGVFRGATVVGLGYESGAQAGTTDGSGQFTYESGGSITFRVGAVILGTAPAAKPLMTPVDLVAGGSGTSESVLNRVRFLLMLDQDGDVRNGIQVSTAVTAVAANWAPVDFSTTDLPTALNSIIQEANAADGSTHVLPDAATAQALLYAAVSCAYSGHYLGNYAADKSPGTRAAISAAVFPDGSMQVLASGSLDSRGAPTTDLSGFTVAAADAVNPSLDATVAFNALAPDVQLQGAFSGPGYLVGTYVAGDPGIFQAVKDPTDAATYMFYSTYLATPGDPSSVTFWDRYELRMDEQNNVVGDIWGGYLTGKVTGTSFSGSLTFIQGHYRTYPVTGTLSNTEFGYSLDGQYPVLGGSVEHFSTTGCRAN